MGFIRSIVSNVYKLLKRFGKFIYRLVAGILKPFYESILFVFSRENMGLSLFLAVGILLSQLFNILCYHAIGAKTLMTWFSTLKIVAYEPLAAVIIKLCLLYAVATFIFSKLILVNKHTHSGTTIIKTGFTVSIIICIISQLLFSSVMRFVYELSICSVVIISVFIERVFFLNKSKLVKEYQELWDLLKFIFPICIGFPVLLGGVGLIRSFYKSEDFIQIQLYRHIAMSLYFIGGASVFIIYPILKRIVKLRETNT